MPAYLVCWAIDIEADSPEEAAQIAQAIQRDPESLATVFDVKESNTDKPSLVIDLSVENSDEANT